MKENECARQYRLLTERLIADGLTVATMESCTAGGIVSLLTDTEGSSAVVRGGIVAYCNEAKTTFGVPEETIARFGVYSEETALAMADACRKRLGAEIGIGVTGSYANRDPNNADSVPGTVFYAVKCGKTERVCRVEVRSALRRDAKTETALQIAKTLSETLDQYEKSRKDGEDA